MVKSVSEPGKAASDYLVHFTPGSVIFNDGDAGDEMFIIQEGEVEIFQILGKKEVPLASLEQGDFFGEMAILESQPRTASARAKTQCSLLPVKGPTFDEMLKRNPEIAVRMMRKLSGRLRQMEQQVRAFLNESTGAAPTPSVGATEAPAKAAPRKPKPPTAAAVNARLVHSESGTNFVLPADDEIAVGRPDPSAGTTPGVDLSPVNQKRTISRRHARILRKDGRFFVAEEVGRTNGTFVNGERVGAGNTQEIKAGDKVDFGAVETVFQL